MILEIEHIVLDFVGQDVILFHLVLDELFGFGDIGECLYLKY